jgi:hypothetical protein
MHFEPFKIQMFGHPGGICIDDLAYQQFVTYVDDLNIHEAKM